MTMANGNGLNGARGAYQGLRNRVEEEAANRPRMPRMAREEWLAEQQRILAARQAERPRRRPSATQVEKARAAEMLLPEEQAARRANARRIQRRRTDDQFM